MANDATVVEMALEGIHAAREDVSSNMTDDESEEIGLYSSA